MREGQKQGAHMVLGSRDFVSWTMGARRQGVTVSIQLCALGRLLLWNIMASLGLREEMVTGSLGGWKERG